MGSMQRVGEFVVGIVVWMSLPAPGPCKCTDRNSECTARHVCSVLGNACILWPSPICELASPRNLQAHRRRNANAQTEIVNAQHGMYAAYWGMLAFCDHHLCEAIAALGSCTMKTKCKPKGVVYRVGPNRTYKRIYGVHTVLLAGDLPCIRSYMVCIHSSGQP